ncbi:MAG: glycosyltransferase [Trueperaceae bacterium]|nr:glycosyltransferase [Trueperaceae bacterium]
MPMHIALVSTFPPSKGTLNEYGFHFARALEKKPEVSRLSIIADTLSENVKEAENIHRVWSFNDAKNAWKINKKLDELNPDAVIFNLQFASFGDQRIPAALGLLAPWMSKRKRLSFTLLHNLFETVDLTNAGYAKNPVIKTAMNLAGNAFTRALLKSDLIATTMPRYVDILRENYGAKNAFLAPHGSFDVGHIAPLPEAPTVMTFGKFGTYKKVEVLLEAHAQLQKHLPDVRLVIAGSDSPNAKGYLETAQKQYSHLSNVEFTGYVAEEDVPRIFSEATVVAFPYESTTGSSGVLHQAGQFGRAAVMPEIGDLADLIADEGYKALSFKPGDVASLTAALYELLSNRAKAQELGEANHRAASGITLDDVADWYLLHISRLLGQTWTLTAQPKPTASSTI